MPNLHNLQRVIIEITSYPHHVTQTKHEKWQLMEAKDTCFCEESFIDRSFLVSFGNFEGRGGGTEHFVIAPWLHKPKMIMVNSV